MKFPEAYRADAPPPYNTRRGDDFGMFYIPPRPLRPGQSRALKVIASAGMDGVPWEHVSVSLMRFRNKTPTWAEMCLVKQMFWESDECVMQLHPPESDYVNLHPGCLHLWRPVDIEIPTPPLICV